MEDCFWVKHGLVALWLPSCNLFLWSLDLSSMFIQNRLVDDVFIIDENKVNANFFVQTIKQSKAT